MNRIDRCFAELRTQQRAGLIPFVTAGDPDPAFTVEILHTLAAAGADLIEIGAPFSDPMADGPVIQHASERALKHGVGLTEILAWVAQFRSRDSKTPVVLMGYLNPLLMYGCERFATDAAQAGLDGVLVVDCPPEELNVTHTLRDCGVHQIFLAAPTTTDARLETIGAATSGFLYYVSFAGVTGAGQLDIASVRRKVDAVKARTSHPVAVGFGIKDAQAAAMIAQFADAVVIGSSLVQRLAGSVSCEEACVRIQEFLTPIRSALNGCRQTQYVG